MAVGTNIARLTVAHPNDLAGEIWGGLGAMLVALPSSIAFGVIIYSPLGASYVAQGAMAGILGAVALGIVTPLFGGAPRLISAPCAPAAVLMSALVADLMNRTPGSQAQLASPQIALLIVLVALVSSGLQFLYGALGGGRLIKFIPYPVVSGYLSGVGILICLAQLPKLFGIPKEHLWTELASPTHWKWQGLAVGAVTMTLMGLGPKLTKTVPPAILGLAGGILAYFGLSLFYPALLELAGNKLVIGTLSEGPGFFNALHDRWTALGTLPLADVRLVFAPALTLSILVSIDTLKTCVIMDTMTRSRHNSNRELLGQGTGNFVSALIGGIPGAGTMGATLVNLNSGGRTRLSSLLEGVFALAVLLLFSKLIAWVPIAALAGILIIVALRMIDRSSFHLLRQKSTILDFAVVLSVVIVAVLKDPMVAAGVGLSLAILLFIRELIRGSVVRRKLYGNQISSKRHRLPEEKEFLENYGTLTTICELQGSLFFGTTDQLFSELEPDLKMSRYVILDLRRIQSVDFTAAHMLEQIEAMLTERNGHLIFSSVPALAPTKQDLRTYFAQVGLINPNQNVKLFDSLDAALEWTEDQILEEQRLLQNGEERALELPEIDLLREFESDQVMTALKSCVSAKSFQQGQTIFKRGETGDQIYLIRRGVIRILLPLGGDRFYNLATFARGNFFGDMAFLDRTVRSADAVAATDADLFVISRTDFDQMSKAHPLLGVKVFARLARAMAIRLRYTDNELRALQEA